MSSEKGNRKKRKDIRGVINSDLDAAKAILDKTPKVKISIPATPPGKRKGDPETSPMSRLTGQPISTYGKGVKRPNVYFSERCQDIAINTALDVLTNIIERSDSDAARVSAIKLLFDRAFGATPKAEELQGEETKDVIDLRALKVVGVPSKADKSS